MSKILINSECLKKISHTSLLDSICIQTILSHVSLFHLYSDHSEHFVNLMLSYSFLVYIASHCQLTDATIFFLEKYGSLLVEGTANTWWILLHNDRKSWHRTIKNQHRYERLRCASKAVMPGWGRGKAGMGGWVKRRTFKWTAAVLLIVIM